MRYRNAIITIIPIPEHEYRMRGRHTIDEFMTYDWNRRHRSQVSDKCLRFWELDDTIRVRHTLSIADRLLKATPFPIDKHSKEYYLCYLDQVEKGEYDNSEIYVKKV